MKRGPEGVSAGRRREGAAAVPEAVPGSLARERWCPGIADFPSRPPAPRKRRGKCERKRRGNPSLGQPPGRDTRGRN